MGEIKDYELLFEAVKEDNAEDIDKYLNSDNVRKKDKDGNTALFFVKSLEATKKIVSSGVMLSHKNHHNETVLHNITDKDSAVFLIKEKGMNVNEENGRKQTPLYNATYRGDTAMMETLIENGANPHAIDIMKCNMMYIAVRANQYKATKLLIKNNVNVNHEDESGITPAFWVDSGSIADALIKAGADVNKKNDEDKTPLFYISNKKVAQKFIDAKADVNAKDKKGNTPIHEAKNIDMVDVFLENGGDLNSKNNDGLSPYQKALKDGRKDVAMHIKEYLEGAKKVKTNIVNLSSTDVPNEANNNKLMNQLKQRIRAR